MYSASPFPYLCNMVAASWILPIFLIAIACPPYSGGEVAEVCAELELSLGCGGREGEVLVVREAWLYGPTHTDRDDDDDEFGWDEGQAVPAECHVREYNLQYKFGSILQYINKECGGQEACKFSLETHVPLTHQQSQLWKGGAMWVNYECVKKSVFHRVCGTEVRAQEGWLKSVAYPHYYLGEPPVCTLTVTVDQGQHILLTVTDLSIREIIQPSENRCRDSLEVSEGSKVKLVRCGDTNKPLEVISEGNSINVTLTASDNVFPKRGYVAHYQAQGCQTPEVPKDGYLSYRNTTHAEFWCCVRHAFLDTLSRRRVLKCTYRSSSWNDTVPDCANLDDLRATGNITDEQYFSLINGSSSVPLAEKLQQAHFVYDLVVPTVIMTVLVLGNVAVVFLIIYCRRGVMEDGTRSEELESIKANPEPTDTIDSEPCNV